MQCDSVAVRRCTTRGGQEKRLYKTPELSVTYADPIRRSLNFDTRMHFHLYFISTSLYRVTNQHLLYCYALCIGSLY